MKTRLVMTLVLTALFLGGCLQQTEYVHVGPNWKNLNELKAGKESIKVNLVTAPNKVKLGQAMRFSVESAKEGNLWVIQVDSNDELGLMFPNKLDRDNAIEAGKPFTIPPKGAGWTLEAGEPTGLITVAFIVTPEGVSLEEALTSRDNSESMEKAIEVVEQAPIWGLAKTVVTVEE